MSDRRTILLIEDDAAQRKVLVDRFTAEGFHVLEATDGEQGFKRALSEQPQLIILDNNMPQMTGFDMLRRLREHNNWGAHVPVIFFSNIEPRSHDEKRDIALITPTAYLIKSETSLDQIVAKINEVLAQNMP